MTGENRNVCCSNGKLASHVAGQVSPGKVTKLPPLPPELLALYKSDRLIRNSNGQTETLGCHMSRNSRRYNAQFAFTSLGYSGHTVDLGNMPHAFTIHGRAYHYLPPGDQVGRPLNWYLFDAHEGSGDGRGSSEYAQDLDPDAMATISNVLNRDNPFIRQGIEPLRAATGNEVGIGDFRQVCPVVPGGGRQAIVDESVKSSNLWRHFTVARLTAPVRDASDPEYSQFLDHIGDGTNNGTDDQVSLDITQHTTDQSQAINFIYPADVLNDPARASTRAILALKNDDVDCWNNAVLETLPGQVDSKSGQPALEEDDRTSAQDAQSFASSEFLNTLQAPGIPRHRLCLKPNCTVVLTRNLSIAEGICKNSRAIVKEIRPRYITVQVLSTGRVVLIPRIDFRFDLPHVPATIRRRQFPLRLAYASTFNSAQGLTLDRVFLDLRIKPFGHGRMYTALTRVRRRSDIRILTLPPSNEVDPAAAAIAAFTTTNVVYSELLR